MNFRRQHLCGLLMAFAGLLGLSAAAIAGTTFYVATDGNDAWSGKLAAPNAERSDGPLATLAKARDAVRALKAAGPLAEPVNVQIRGGVYYITETLAFGPGDSGGPGAAISYEAYPGETPELVGGRRIEGLRRKGPDSLVHLPAVEAGEWYFRQLFVNGRLQVRARYPCRPQRPDPAASSTWHPPGGFGVTVKTSTSTTTGRSTASRSRRLRLRVLDHTARTTRRSARRTCRGEPP